VFTGKETKLMKNSRAAPAKRSSVEKMMNYALLTIFIFMFSIAIISSGLSVAFLVKLTLPVF
jgi:phospholipid-transporting ATPase